LKTFSLNDVELESTEGDKNEKTHFVYACVKKVDADDICAKYYDLVIEKMTLEAEQERLYVK
jgi:hypothetical protein